MVTSSLCNSILYSRLLNRMSCWGFVCFLFVNLRAKPLLSNWVGYPCAGSSDLVPWASSGDSIQILCFALLYWQEFLFHSFKPDVFHYTLDTGEYANDHSDSQPPFKVAASGILVVLFFYFLSLPKVCFNYLLSEGASLVGKEYWTFSQSDHINLTSGYMESDD